MEETHRNLRGDRRLLADTICTATCVILFLSKLINRIKFGVMLRSSGSKDPRQLEQYPTSQACRKVPPRDTSWAYSTPRHSAHHVRVSILERTRADGITNVYSDWLVHGLFSGSHVLRPSGTDCKCGRF